MIKAFKAKCTKDLLYEKARFTSGEIYIAYVSDSKIVVLNEEFRKGFCDIEKCMFLHGHPYGFQKYFEVQEEFYVQNKKELKMFGKEI